MNNLECGCPFDQRLYLYVGKAVMLRNRLQVHAFGGSSAPVSPWIYEFQDDPHNHQVFASAWYVQKNELSLAEAVLIDALKPTRNKRDRGIGRPEFWPFRMSDVDAIDIESLEPDKKHTRFIVRNSQIRHEPAAYAWWVDPGADLMAMHDGFRHLEKDAPNKIEVKRFRNMVATRLRAARKLPSSHPRQFPKRVQHYYVPEDMMSEQGICGSCGKSDDCLNTSHGWMCRPCFHAAMKTNQKSGPRLYTLPDPGQKVFVVKEPPGTYITFNNVLYAYYRKCEADEIADGLRKAYGIPGAYVQEVDAREPHQYVLDHPDLKLLGIAERIEGKRTAGSGEVEAPAL